MGDFHMIAVCLAGPILESKGVLVIFQKKGKKMLKKGEKGKDI